MCFILAVTGLSSVCQALALGPLLCICTKIYRVCGKLSFEFQKLTCGVTQEENHKTNVNRLITILF